MRPRPPAAIVLISITAVPGTAVARRGEVMKRTASILAEMAIAIGTFGGLPPHGGRP
jgi:hypothetical protein